MVQPGNVRCGHHWVLGEVESLPRLAEALPDLSLQVDRFLHSALQGLGRVHEQLGRGSQSTQPWALCHSEVGTHRPSVSGNGCGTVNDSANDTSQSLNGTEL